MKKILAYHQPRDVRRRRHRGRQSGLVPDPAAMPFAPPTTTQKLVNLKKARELGLAIPEALLRDAEQVTETSQK